MAGGGAGTLTIKRHMDGVSILMMVRLELPGVLATMLRL